MSQHVLEPRLRTDAATRLRREYMSDPEAAEFDLARLEAALDAPGAFPTTGGVPATVDELLAFRSECLEAVDSLENTTGQEFGAVFDLAVGAVLHQRSDGRRGEFGHPEVWDFMTLVLLPDLAMRRVTAGQMPSAASFTARTSGGNRRHVFQRLWRRWAVFGQEIVEERILSEDDYVALLERNLTSDRPVLAQLVAERIRSVEGEYDNRRQYTRVFMRRLLAASGFLALSVSDTPHLHALVEHVHAETARALGTDHEERARGRTPLETMAPQAAFLGAPAPQDPAPSVAKRKPRSWRSLLGMQD